MMLLFASIGLLATIAASKQPDRAATLVQLCNSE